MLKLRDFSTKDIGQALRGENFRLSIGSFHLKVKSDAPELARTLGQLYAEYPASISGGAYHYDVEVSAPSLLRRWWRRNVVFRLSGDSPFLPMQAAHAHAMFEWGLNWTIGACAHHLLILHSAVVARAGCGVLLAATSGSGKSTLAAELALSGWRLLSDELALIDRQGFLVPCARPVSLKNQSIDVIRARHPDAVCGPLAHDTHKGRIAHIAAPAASVADNLMRVQPRLVLIPKWSADAKTRLQRVGSGDAALRLIDQSFNYPILGTEGFRRLCRLVDDAPAWELEYADLDEARTALEALAEEHA